ncbi:unnamed protein product [Trichobilharzia regenti]|nr:unnamed protein product [Trichobilharzia regenti]
MDQKRNRAYFQKSWNYFDAFMLLCIWASLALQCVEFYVTFHCPISNNASADSNSNNYTTTNNNNGNLCPSNENFRRHYGFLSMIRCPRPLILIREGGEVVQFIHSCNDGRGKESGCTNFF